MHSHFVLELPVNIVAVRTFTILTSWTILVKLIAKVITHIYMIDRSHQVRTPFSHEQSFEYAWQGGASLHFGHQRHLILAHSDCWPQCRQSLCSQACSQEHEAVAPQA